MPEALPHPARSTLARLDHELAFGITHLPCKSASPAETLDSIAAEVSSCALCPLAEGRTHPVPGEGYAAAPIVFVGEGPGRDEDLSGRPFVGPAGQLLDRMMKAIDLDRTTAYIANVVKCRPPGNRVPTPLESATCISYLKRQLRVIRPRIVCTLGGVATSALLERPIRITAIRGQRFDLDGCILIPTLHPAYLLRNPAAKKDAWIDLKLIRSLLDATP